MSHDETTDFTTEKPGNIIYAVIDFLSQFKSAAFFLLLAGVIFLSFPLVSFIRARDKLILCQENLKNLGTALEMYSTDHCGHYPDKMKSVIPDYIKSIPKCPSAGMDTYSADYRRFT